MVADTAMQDIRAAVEQLREMPSLGVLNSDSAALHRLRSICPNSPDEVIYLYSQIGGTEETIGAEFEMMSVSDLLEFYGSTQDDLSESQFGELLDPSLMLPIFVDCSGNYAGVFVGSPLRGRCFIHDQDDRLNLPVFRSLGRMIQAFSRVHDTEDCNHYDLTGDYPVRDDSQLLPDDGQISSDFLKEYFELQEPDIHLALLAMQLSPASDTDLLLRMLEEDDMWVQEKACELIGYRRFVGGIGKMVEVALQDENNATIAAIAALKGWDEPEAVAGLTALKRSLPDSYSAYWQD